MFKFLIIVCSLISFSVTSFAARSSTNTQCQKSTTNPTVAGLNIDELFTIASVTKVFTSYWAILQLGPRYHFENKIHINALTKNLYDVHIEGSQFPYFDKTMFQFFVSELNKLGVFNIRNLTYDENFEYASIVRTNSSLAHQNNDQNSQEIMHELRRDTTTLSNNYPLLVAKSLSLEGLRLQSKLSLMIGDIHFLSKNEYQKNTDTVSYQFNSSELYRTLKELNRNSHNFAADKIYEKLSRKENFNDFITKRLNIARTEVDFYNGSGYPVMANGTKSYNTASCRAVVEMLFDLKNVLITGNMALHDIMPVAGKDSAIDGTSTVTQIYGSNLTSGALIAKTGTVANSVSLAGLIMTENESVFFHTSYKYDGSYNGRNQSYQNIKNWVAGILKQKGSTDDLDNYVPKSFLPFDKTSTFVKIEPTNLP